MTMNKKITGHRFCQVALLGIAVSNIAFIPLVQSELIITFTDDFIRCYNIGKK
jgi:hypothetical protein